MSKFRFCGWRLFISRIHRYEIVFSSIYGKIIHANNDKILRIFLNIFLRAINIEKFKQILKEISSKYQLVVWTIEWVHFEISTTANSTTENCDSSYRNLLTTVNISRKKIEYTLAKKGNTHTTCVSVCESKENIWNQSILSRYTSRTHRLFQMNRFNLKK